MTTIAQRGTVVPDRRVADQALFTYQKRVDDYFRSAAQYWKQIYEKDRVHAAVHQHRLQRVVGLVDQLALSKTARGLDIGCGAGLISVAIAERGYRVDAMDTVPAMIEFTRELAALRSVASRVEASIGDIQRIEAAGNTYDLVVAIGVLPWLHDIDLPLYEVRRVLRPGGAFVVNIDSKWGLNRIIDPRLNPLLYPLKRSLRYVLRRAGWCDDEAIAVTMSHRRFDRRLRCLGFSKEESTTLGFGPFTFFGCELTSSLGGELNRRMQAWADRGGSLVRSLGAQYLVDVRKGN